MERQQPFQHFVRLCSAGERRGIGAGGRAGGRVGGAQVQRMRPGSELYPGIVDR